MGVNIQLALQDYFDQVQKKAEDAMAQITLQDILDRYGEKLAALAPPPSEEAAAAGEEDCHG